MERPERERITTGYRRFAAEEARGRSPLYEEFARRVAGDPEIIDLLADVPREKRQPNLLLAAARSICGTSWDFGEFRRQVLGEWEAIRAVMLARSTQTNEPGRCATLLPVLALLPQPLALIEVGASAGLCLLPDCYGYDYGGRLISPPRQGAPVFPCAVDSKTPLPTSVPNIVWRAGLDLDPIDLGDPERIAWLETLVWPEQRDRLARLRAAIEIAKANPPRIVTGDLRRDLVSLAAEAPKGATLVIFHTAVLVYVASAVERNEFARSARSLCDFWVASEAPRIFPDIAERSGETGPPGGFLMSVSGEPVAWADPHGAWLRWIADPPPARRG